MAVPGRYRTGDAELDAAIVELLQKGGIDQHDDLLFEMIVTFDRRPTRWATR